MIKRGISHETGRLVDFDKPGFGLFVQENVDTQYLEAKLVFKVLRLSSSLCVSDMIMAGDNCFNSQFFELLPALLARDHLGIFLFGCIDGFED